MTETLIEDRIDERPYTKVERPVLVASLRERDGDSCQYPGDEHTLDFKGTGPNEVTIDHWMPQSYGKANGWSMEEIWALSNLRLMCKKHNAKKGDLIPNADGTLPDKKVRTWKNRRAKRSVRPEICTSCNAGRALGPDEYCRTCGSGAQPERFPKWRQMKPSDCDHEDFYCVACTIWSPELRSGATMALIAGTESTMDEE